ncbi:CDP-glucose 4,6-dehydratase [Parafilimonas terrae]|uniref:CDP-glucose 4,6-dehydratase n=1 Tax=Parafilimonas terrae TaxID=1465490 RepID=A0A1I5UF88_9BACT|nr:CDP-glucose 4,6-dehydratase [Parafilimonas terrae]SFP93879.1 CDP-glucose 4,6-dehydratase [Parafilimonas terrae]
MENMVKSPAEYYHNKKVFITGHTGFKGSWLCALLYNLNAQIKGYALEPEYIDGLYNTLEPFMNIQSVIADIRDKQRLKEEIENFEPDYVFHLAAQPLVRRSYQIPAETFDVNVTGTANLLEALISLKKKCTIVVITTDKVYENKEDNSILYEEDNVLGGYDPYSASKACAELVISSFRNSFFNSQNYQQHQKTIASARAGNVIGGGDWNKDRIIPDIIRALKNDNTISVRNPGAIRPWQHVLEPLVGYLLLGGMLNDAPQQFSKAYNFGPLPDDHLTVKELVEIAIKTWGSGEWEDNSDASAPHEAGLLKLSIQRALEELNWRPKLNAQQAIGWTVNWYKQAPETIAAYTFQQIKDYLSL